ncbi:hypothetical protein FNV43_RR24520 [Rhamnella rubrinervis]|uniref:Uncharacterized protein n=1 Tax=Rhamnella rubrinervis TaxID=2594499 RepID=A0A8K0DQP3_9ROSA|nr:hypothetical protein FNV43_RR24520 [Rhamnella rubrinervis]
MNKFEMWWPFDESEVDDNVRVCIFYLFKMILLADAKRKAITCDQYKLFHNKEKSERYSCGSLAYDFAIKYLRNIVNHHNTSNTFKVLKPFIFPKYWVMGITLQTDVLESFAVNFQGRSTFILSRRKFSKPKNVILTITMKEKKDAYITSLFNSIVYCNYDGSPLVVVVVDETNVDPHSNMIPLSKEMHKVAELIICSHNDHEEHEVYISVNNENKYRCAVEVDYVNQHVMIYDNYLELMSNGTLILDTFTMSRVDGSLCLQQAHLS